MSLSRSERVRKPVVLYSPEITTPIYRAARKITRGDRMSNCDQNNNKWDKYRKKAKQLIHAISRESHYFDVLTQDARKKGVVNVSQLDGEVSLTLDKLNKTKLELRSLFEAISNENNDHKVWPQLGEADEDDQVEVEDVMCSLCRKPDEDGNDILFCDHKQCFKAYHQNCCEPPERSPDPEDDWFCRQCQCLDDWQVNSLAEVNECLSLDYEDVGEVFKEMTDKCVDINTAGAGINYLLKKFDEEDEDDEDYCPEGDDEDENSVEVSSVITKRITASSSRNDIKSDANTSDEVDVNNDINGTSTSGSNCDNETQSDSDDIDGSSAGAHSVESDGDSDGLEEDEVAALLRDAEVDLEALVSPIVDVHGDRGDVDVSPIRRRLRKRTSQRNQESSFCCQLEGVQDVGKRVARIRSGAVWVGTVTKYIPAQGYTDEIKGGNIDESKGVNANEVAKKDDNESNARDIDKPKGADARELTVEDVDKRKDGEGNVDVTTATLALESASTPLTETFLTGDGVEFTGDRGITCIAAATDIAGYQAAACMVATSVPFQAHPDMSSAQVYEDTWEITFKNNSVQYVNRHQFRELLQKYHDLMQTSEAFKWSENAPDTDAETEEKADASTELGCIDPSNIVDSKRRRTQVDYSKLHVEMFGTDDYSEPSDEEVTEEDLRRLDFELTRRNEIIGNVAGDGRDLGRGYGAATRRQSGGDAGYNGIKDDHSDNSTLHFRKRRQIKQINHFGYDCSPDDNHNKTTASSSKRKSPTLVKTSDSHNDVNETDSVFYDTDEKSKVKPGLPLFPSIICRAPTGGTILGPSIKVVEEAYERVPAKEVEEDWENLIKMFDNRQNVDNDNDVGQLGEEGDDMTTGNA